jgi:hypothetical protein
MELDKAFEALGLAAEFTPAAAIYFIFLWLDRKSSDEAREALSMWTRGEGRMELQAPAVALFDRIYSYPLLRVRAFYRSALITSTIFLLWMSYLYWQIEWFWSPWILIFVPLLFGNLLSDYCSLFLVRAILRVASTSRINFAASCCHSGCRHCSHILLCRL